MLIRKINLPNFIHLTTFNCLKERKEKSTSNQYFSQAAIALSPNQAEDDVGRWLEKASTKRTKHTTRPVVVVDEEAPPKKEKHCWAHVKAGRQCHLCALFLVRFARIRWHGATKTTTTTSVVSATTSYEKERRVI